VRVAHSDGLVVVSVAVTFRAGRWLPGIPLHARAAAEAER
jgi:hypothetical protein